MKILILLTLSIILIVKNSELQKNLKRKKVYQIQNSKEKSLDTIESQLKLKLKKSAPRFKKNMKVNKKSEIERDASDNKSQESASQHNSEEVLNKNNVEQQENQSSQENPNEQSQPEQESHEKKEENNHVEEKVQEHHDEKKEQINHNEDKMQENHEDKDDHHKSNKQEVFVQENNNNEESHNQQQKVFNDKNKVITTTTTTITTTTVIKPSTSTSTHSFNNSNSSSSHSSSSSSYSSFANSSSTSSTKQLITKNTNNQIVKSSSSQNLTDKEKVSSFLPKIIKLGDDVNLTQLNMNLMTENKFNQEFDKWQDSDYVSKISEYGRQELKAKRSGLKKEYNVIKNSFIKDKELNEEPMIYKEIQGTQFTDVLTPVQQTATQGQLWKNFKTSHFYDVDYKGREDDKSNIEIQYDSQGNTKLFEKVINNKPVKIHNTSIKVDIDPVAGILDDIVNPLHPLSIDKQTDKNIKLDHQNNQYKKQKTLENVMEDIDEQIKSN